MLSSVLKNVAGRGDHGLPTQQLPGLLLLSVPSQAAPSYFYGQNLGSENLIKGPTCFYVSE